MLGRRAVAVAGAHGKTTTSALIATVLRACGVDPSFAIGGTVRTRTADGVEAAVPGGHLGASDVLVAEADESDGSFRHLFPYIAVVTNIDREHMDHYGDLQTLRAAFVDFANKVPFYGLVVLGADDPTSASLAPELLKRHVTYGLRGGDYRGQVLDAGPEGTRLRIAVRGKDRGEIRVRMPGIHYAENALAVLCVADFLGVPFADYAGALETFQGVDRRFSVRGEAGGVLVVDDYGHHPTEMAATIAAARLYGRRLVVAFQPHRYTRTRDLFAEFAPALGGADVVVLTDIYAAGEPPLDGVTSRHLMATLSAHAGAAHYAPRPELVGRLEELVRAGDLVLVLGAGDITHAAGELLARLGAKKAGA
jgi:UDP-N-acetylmuramate--alanine ligase